MRIVRFATEEGPKFGVLEGDVIRGISGSPFDQFTGPGCNFELDGSTCRLGEVPLLSPCAPSKVLCMEANHLSWGEASNTDEDPLIFLKTRTSVIGPEESIVFPAAMKNVGFEGELAVVFGRKATDVPKEKAKDYILGYTCLNDVSDYDAIDEDEASLTRAKGRDTFAPLGPWIETDIDYETAENLKIESFLNGQRFQSGFTRDLIHPVSSVVSFMTNIMTMLPGDVIGTGTPKKSNERMKDGDVIEIEIDGIGTLRNAVVQI